MAKINILLADDDLIFCRLVKDILQQDGHRVVVANNVNAARDATSQEHFDIIMLDMCFPSIKDGFTLLEEFHEAYPNSTILMISGAGHIPDAVLALKYGAQDFIEKPVEPPELRERVNRLAQRMSRDQESINKFASIIGIVGKSTIMQEILDKIHKAAEFDTPVLITGETGVGKELAAHAIHRLSKFAHKPMVSINCASVPKELFEAELFGYEEGAFTGATRSRMGYFEFAKDNSFFLDEVIELPLVLQAKLLRVISEGEIQKVGGKVMEINTRIISATNQSLEQAVESGIFREDLLYRLNAIHIRIPPLRERPEDIIPLARCFVKDFCQRNNIPIRDITPDALSYLYQSEWQGNARELRNSLERAMIFSDGKDLELKDFTKGAQHFNVSDCLDTKHTLREAMRVFERNYIEFHYRQNEYSLARTAEKLGLDRSNLHKKITAYCIKEEEE
ncbi:MAG: sigma-54-dependent Fis family transcriptional regulator [Candidatus Cloacimonetes bacterium]|nr:sigma-54-dependent Fis family transcriptional regulator [Candidatus Cloacimonadota bacterium]